MIYSEDIRACNQYTQQGPAECARMVQFVLATIQQQLETVPRIVADFENVGSASRFAFGSKAKGLEWLAEHQNMLYRAAMAARGDDERLLAAFLAVPGLGLVKAGFCSQIFNNQVGCIDVHNIKLYDIPLSAIRYGYKLKPETQKRKRERYAQLCDSLGGSAALWSRWCDYLATVRPANWRDGREVSRFHVDVIAGIETGAIVDLFDGTAYEPAFMRQAVAA